MKSPQLSATLNSVVDPRSVFIEMKICEKVLKQSVIAAQVCHLLAPNIMMNWSRFTNSIWKHVWWNSKLQTVYPLRCRTCTSNHRTEIIWVWFLCPRKIWSRLSVRTNSLETNKCDALFSRMQLKIDSNNFVPLYHEQFDYGHDNVLWIISTEALSVSPGYTKVIPAHIPNWKRPLIQVCALFKPRDMFETNSEVSARKYYQSPPETANTNWTLLRTPLTKISRKHFHDQFKSSVNVFSGIFAKSERD